jgi:hypothetical protein
MDGTGHLDSGGEDGGGRAAAVADLNQGGICKMQGSNCKYSDRES